MKDNDSCTPLATHSNSPMSPPPPTAVVAQLEFADVVATATGRSLLSATRIRRDPPEPPTVVAIAQLEFTDVVTHRANDEITLVGGVARQSHVEITLVAVFVVVFVLDLLAAKAGVLPQLEFAEVVGPAEPRDGFGASRSAMSAPATTAVLRRIFNSPMHRADLDGCFRISSSPSCVAFACAFSIFSSQPQKLFPAVEGVWRL